MFRYIELWFGLLTPCLQSHRSLLLENLALRQQLAVLKRKQPRPRMEVVDRIFWVFARRFWGAWKQSLVLVNPETVVGWHRAGFRLYWSWISKARKQVGRKKLSPEVREPIFRMMAENPTWGAPRIHGELHMLGFQVSERSVSRWDEASSEGSPASPALARLSSESQGSDCGHGLLHRAHDQLGRPLLLLCHPPRSPAYPAFQQHEASDKRLDHPAAAGGVSRSRRLPDFSSTTGTQNTGWRSRQPFDPSR